MRTEEVLKGVEILKKEGEIPGTIAGITDRADEVKPGYLFIARKGEITDGHEFMEEAKKKGAVLFVVEREVEIKPWVLVPDGRIAMARIASNYYGNPSKFIKLIGITGTNGKTTVAYLLHSIYHPALLIGTIEYIMGEKSIPSTNTTPSPIFINRILREALDRGLNTCVMEVSSHALKQRRVEFLDFDFAVFTNLSRDHLDYHKTFEDYRESKGRLFSMLKEEAYAVINIDDPEAPYFIEVSGGKKITYGLSGGNVVGRVGKCDLEGIEMEIEGLGKKIKVSSSLVGRHNALNILAAVSAALLDGVPEESIVQGIKKLKGVPGRMERVGKSLPFYVFVDYAHTPSAMESLLLSVRELVKGRIITVFGAGGERDRGKREEMGRVAYRLSERVIITSDNPRGESPEKIAAEIKQGAPDAEVVLDRREAIKRALGLAGEGDAVLILGKGHETYQIIGKRVIPFDDRKVAREILREMGYEGV